MNLVGQNIRKFRTQKGYSQEYMAESLGITQPSYARLEKDDNRINVVRLLQIAQYLEVNVGELLGHKAQMVTNQSNNKTATAYNVDKVSKIINADKEFIASLKGEIAFLREVLSKKLD
jgi:transcriptional regulator with XRE-family HTH domain